MPLYPRLDDDSITAIAIYLASLKPDDRPPPKDSGNAPREAIPAPVVTATPIPAPTRALTAPAKTPKPKPTPKKKKPGVRP